MSGLTRHPAIDPPSERLDAADAGNHSEYKASKKQQHSYLLKLECQTKHLVDGNISQGLR